MGYNEKMSTPSLSIKEKNRIISLKIKDLRLNAKLNSNERRILFKIK